MKKGLLLLSLAMVVLMAACSKEKSVEKSTEQSLDNTWQFSLGSREYKGIIDTSFVQDFTSIQLIQVEGYTTDGMSQFLLGFGGLALEEGEYVFPFANVFYAEDTDVLFETDPLQPGFKIVITELTALRVAGTFSGTVTLSATGEPVQVTNGRFSALR